ncbi:MAG: SDR family NAD(P)-dependent oxidoreductase [Pseudomonadales bacterium]
MTKRCVITGPTSGIGLATAEALACEMNLVLVCRNAQKGEELKNRLLAKGNEVDLVVCDLSSLQQVSLAGELIARRYPVIDVLINNAGLINTSRELSVDGYEMMLATNHFGPFLLSSRLLSSLRASPAARIINVASAAHAFVRGIQFDDMNYEKGFSVFKTYGHSKLCNILHVKELTHRLEDTNIVVNSLHPGAVSTNLGTQNGWFGKAIFAVLRPFFRTVEKGAASSIWLALSEEGGQLNGEYIVDCKVRQPKLWATDAKTANELWSYTEKAIEPYI